MTSYFLEVLLAAILECGSGRYETAQARLLFHLPTKWQVLVSGSLFYLTYARCLSGVGNDRYNKFFFLTFGMCFIHV